MVVILQGQSVSAPATVTKTDWSSRPGDLGALWIAGGTLSPADFSMSGISMSSTSGSDVKLTGKTTLAVEGNTPPIFLSWEEAGLMRLLSDCTTNSSD